MAVLKKLMTVFQCERCEHEWIPRNEDELPTICPRCKSPYWNRPRQNPKRSPAKKSPKRKTAKK